MKKSFTYEHIEIVRILDGDTMEINIDLGFHIIHNVFLRIDGIDTPEKRTRNLDEKAAGIAVTNFTESMFAALSRYEPSYAVTITKKPKYAGRAVGSLTIITDDFTLNWTDFLIKHKMASPYDGGAKEEFTKKFLKDIAALDDLSTVEYSRYLNEHLDLLTTH